MALRLGSLALAAVFAWWMLVSSDVEALNLNSGAGAPPEPTAAMATDRLAMPVLGESPTQVESGNYLYYHHCMPCHGDRGQGLTDEWREVWIEDHQNCWARGCHTGQANLSSFYIPRVVPPVIGSGHLYEADDLFTLIRATQPPQRPGALLDTEYWALTAFLLYEDGRLAPGTIVGPQASPTVATGDVLVAMLAILLALFAGSYVGKRQGEIAR